jgi:hypothetical protein
MSTQGDIFFQIECIFVVSGSILRTVMHRPKRACTERAQEKIREILQWEACTEDSQMFKDVEAQLERELGSEVNTREYVPSSASESDSASDDACSDSETLETLETLDKKEESFNPNDEE